MILVVKGDFGIDSRGRGVSGLVSNRYVREDRRMGTRRTLRYLEAQRVCKARDISG